MQAYANSAVCTASRVAFITGRYQYRLPSGSRNLWATAKWACRQIVHHAAVAAQKAGYGTTLLANGIWAASRFWAT